MWPSIMAVVLEVKRPVKNLRFLGKIANISVTDGKELGKRRIQLMSLIKTANLFQSIEAHFVADMKKLRYESVCEV